jgi:hypothetical protein
MCFFCRQTNRISTLIDGADAGDQQRRDLGLLHQRDHRAEVFLVGVRREAVVRGLSMVSISRLREKAPKRGAGVPAGLTDQSATQV